MTTEPWTTKLPHIIAKGVSDEDIFLVKMLTIDKFDGVTEISTHIYTAHLIYYAPYVFWFVDNNFADDSNDEPLEIEATDTDAILGHLEIHDDNGNSSTYVITSCFKYTYNNKREHYDIIDALTNDIITHAQTKKEAAIIVNELRKAGVDAGFMKATVEK